MKNAFNNKEVFDSERDIRIIVGESEQFASPPFADAVYTERKLFDDFQKEHHVTLVEILKWWIENRNIRKSDLHRAVEMAFIL